MREMLSLLAELSDDSLAKPLTEAVRNFLANRPNATKEETERFISELRDWAVNIGGANDFVMTVFSALIGTERIYPPPVLREILWLDQWKHS